MWPRNEMPDTTLTDQFAAFRVWKKTRMRLLKRLQPWLKQQGLFTGEARRAIERALSALQRSWLLGCCFPDGCLQRKRIWTDSMRSTPEIRPLTHNARSVTNIQTKIRPVTILLVPVYVHWVFPRQSAQGSGRSRTKTRMVRVTAISTKSIPVHNQVGVPVQRQRLPYP